jgi:hypothetical protein
MKIRELKDILSRYPDEMDVVISYYEGEFINRYYHCLCDKGEVDLEFYDYSIRDNHYEYYSDEETEEFKSPDGKIVFYPEVRKVLLIEVDR